MKERVGLTRSLGIAESDKFRNSRVLKKEVVSKVIICQTERERRSYEVTALINKRLRSKLKRT